MTRKEMEERIEEVKDIIDQMFMSEKGREMLNELAEYITSNCDNPIDEEDG